MIRTLVMAGMLLACLFGSQGFPAAAEAAGILDECSGIDDDAARLRCYDEMAGRKPKAPAVTAAPSPPAESRRVEPSFMSKRWQLDEESRKKRFAIMSHRQNYLLPFTYNFHQEKETYESISPNSDVDDAEAKYQISLKVKLWQDILGTPMDLWFGYTQMSLWQVYNTGSSSYFRETNYEPEVLLSIGTRFSLLGLKGRFIQLGVNHQSNGQSEPLSRSWNRLVANVGIERGNLSILFKGWYRIPDVDDDNPGLTHFTGNGELWAYYFLKRHRLGVMVRDNLNFRENRGALQLEWSFPIFAVMAGHIQYFLGYGESLLDYNHRVHRIGFGFIFSDWY